MLLFLYLYTRIQTSRINEFKDLVITLERTVCYGTCPIYKLTLDGDGRVIYEGEEHVRVIGTSTTQISLRRVKKIVSEFYNVDYFSLKDDYLEWDITDMPGAITAITINGKTKTIRHYHGDKSAPKELTKLEDRIDEIVGSQRWIGK